MPPFVILGLPRSRTAWLARFLTYGDWVCGHEEARHWRSLDDARTWFAQPNIGTAETAAAPFWRLLDDVAPDARIVIVRRPIADVVESLMRVGEFDRAALVRQMERLERKLDQIERRRAVLSVRFEDLAHERFCKQVFEHCLPYAHDHQHYAALADQNVQCDMRALLRYATAYLPALTKLAAVARHRTLTAMALREPVAEGMTFQVEPFDVWLRDAQPLFAEHCTQVGEAPDEWQQKNVPLMRRLDKLGVMQILTARANGRMFGYLQTVVGPSLESENVIVGSHGTFFASPDAPGLGLKLQRAALRALRKRGVGEVKMQAGVRGSGSRLDTIYKRLGAQEDGRVYRLQLAGA